MSDEVNSIITFSCLYGGKIDTVDGNFFYKGGAHRFIECEARRLFSELMNKLPVSLYGQRVWFKVPFEEVEERKLLTNSDTNFKRMCNAARWTNAIDIFVEPEAERIETDMVGIDRGEDERGEEERGDAERGEAERGEIERDEHQFDEEARVERNVADFVDEEIDEFATPVGSDDDDHDNEREGYVRYKKGSGDLQLRHAFDNLEAFKQAMVDYVLKHGWNVKYCRWDQDKYELKCASESEEGEEDCMWRIYCSYEEPLQKWLVKVYIKNHSCMKNGHSKLLTSKVIARLFVDDIRENPKIKPKEIVEEIHKRWELIASIDQCRKAKGKALKNIKEEHELQFSRLRDYRIELLESNEDSTCELETFLGDDGKDVFYRFYICFGVLKKTWSSHCRPIFGLDGCFLKCTTNGQLLAVVGRDANNQMFPIAWAVVDVENEENWTWFIQKLQSDLDLHDGAGFTVISDRQKGLLNVVAALLPMVEHRMCARHIYANLKKNHPNRADMKGLFWKVAKSYNTPQYTKRVDEIKAYDMSVYNSMMMKNPKNCSLAFFTPASCCDDVSNNISKAFNSAIDPARAMPLVEMLETIRRRAMQRINARKAKSLKHRGKFTIKAMEKVDEEQKKIRHCRVYPAGHDSFEVKEKTSSYKVKMLDRTCSCRRWEMSRLPCRHTLKVIAEKKRRQEDYMADCYLTSTWRNQYATTIKAVHGVNFWKNTDEAGIVPPPPEEEPARGRKKIRKRIKGRNESPTKKKKKDTVESPTKISRERRIMHCGRCGESGHNTRKCQNIGVPLQRPPKKKNVAQGRDDLGEGSSQPMQSQVID